MQTEEMDLPEYVPHPNAVLLPDLPSWKYEALKSGIEDHGLQYPIRIQKGTRFLLDGRFRQRACLELGIPIRVEEIAIPDDAVAVYTGAEAAKRDGLTVTERVLIATSLLPEFARRAAERQRLGVAVREGEEKGKAAAQAASLVGVSARTVESAISLKTNRPDLWERVLHGEMDLAAARREAEGTAPRAKAKATPKNEIQYPVPEYLRARLTLIADVVGRDTLGEAIEALLDYAEGSPGWAEWAEARRQGAIA